MKLENLKKHFTYWHLNWISSGASDIHQEITVVQRYAETWEFKVRGFMQTRHYQFKLGHVSSTFSKTYLQIDLENSAADSFYLKTGNRFSFSEIHLVMSIQYSITISSKMFTAAWNSIMTLILKIKMTEKELNIQAAG